MWNVSTFLFILRVILGSIELSSQYDSSPDVASASGVPRGRSSTHTKKASQRLKSRSPSASFIEPPTRIPTSEGHQYELDQLQSIRLISIKNPQREFELQRYTFPEETAIRMNERHSSVYPPVPSDEQIVVSTHDRQVLAIYTSENTLAGLYIHNPLMKRKGRAKINIDSGAITPLTSDEGKECPVGPHRRIFNDFRIVHMNISDRPHSPPMSPPAESSSRARSRSPVSRCVALPTRLPSADGNGYGLDQLRFIILTSILNPELGFQLRKYSFSVESQLLLHVGPNQYVPIPSQEQIVLSTVSGDVFAILESANYLAGIYKYDSRIGFKNRVKINMRSRTSTPLTSDEKRQTPTGRLRPILNYFRVHNSRDKFARH